MSDKIKRLLSNNKKKLNNNKEVNFQNINYDNQNISYNDINEDNNNITEENNYIIDDLNNDIDNENNNKKNSITGLSNNITTEQDNELPLITLNFISICQCCKNKFDSKNNLPYLLKCGHFFCVNCIKQYFTDQTGVVCPSDGLVAKSINELTLLKNLIIDSKNQKKNNSLKKSTYNQLNLFRLSNNKNNIDDDNNYKMSNYCLTHKNQKLSHIIKGTNEIICVHCAFDRLKSNPNLEIKELKEIYNEYNDNLEIIMKNCQKNIELIQHTLDLINKNKENEEKKLNLYYNNIIKFVENQRKERKEQIENIFKENTHDLEQRLLIFNEIIEQGDELQKLLEKDEEMANQTYSKVLNNYNCVLKLNKSNIEDNTNNKLKYIKDNNENEANIKDYLNKISNLNIIYRIIKYIKAGRVHLEDINENKFQKIENELSDNNNSSVKYHKTILDKKRIFNNNIKNLSCENLYENKNYSNNFKETNYFIHNYSNSNKNYTKINNLRNRVINSTKNSNALNRTPFFKNQEQNEEINNKRSLRVNKSLINSNNLLESYLELKNKEKSMSLNNYDNFNMIDMKAESQKNSKSFNNLNILNNFYNLDYSRSHKNNYLNKKPAISHFNSKKNYDSNNMKLYNESLRKLIPQQFRQFNKTFNFKKKANI